MNNLLKLVGDRWKLMLISIALLLLNVSIRTIEPKVLQATVAYLELNHFESSDPFVSVIGQFVLWLQSALGAQILFCLGFVFIIFAFFRSIFALASKAISIRIAEQSIFQLRVKIFYHIQRLPIAAFDQLNKGEMIQRLSGDIETIKNFLTNHLVEFLRLVFTASIASYMLITIDLEYALWCIALSPIVLLSSIFFFRFEKTIWDQHETAADRLTHFVQENFNGIKTIQAYSKQSSEILKFDMLNLQKRNMGLMHNQLHVVYWPSMDLLTLMQMFMIVIIGGYYYYTHHLSLAQFTTAFAYSGMITWPLKMIGRTLSMMGMAWVALDRIYEILDMAVEEVEGETVESLNHTIEFRDVSFAYHADSPNVLTNINFKIHPGQKLAIVGQYSSGKTTIIKLLLQFYKPSSGQILLNGIPIQCYHKQQYRHRIAYVTQQPYLFSMNIKDNILYSGSHHSDDELYSDISLAGFSDFHQSFSKGLDTEVGEKGVSLSGGQKQRLSLARAISRPFDWLILDDFTSALDRNTEKQVMSNIEHLIHDKICIMITHRLDTMTKADMVMVLSPNGTIEMFGTPNEVIKNSQYVSTMSNFNIAQY